MVEVSSEIANNHDETAATFLLLGKPTNIWELFAASKVVEEGGTKLSHKKSGPNCIESVRESAKQKFSGVKAKHDIWS